MKSFFKRNLAEIILFALALLCYMLSFLSFVLFAVACILVGIALIIVFFKTKKRVNERQLKRETDNRIFDATKFDYDEDIYFLGNPKLIENDKSKKFAKIEKNMLFVMLGFVAFAFIFVGVFFIIKMIF